MKSLANRNCAEVRNPMNKENVKQSTVDIFCEKKNWKNLAWIMQLAKFLGSKNSN